jgi:hypothetical protein
VSDLPAGFDAVYRCKNHPERDATSPLCDRWCDECREEARHRWVEHAIRKDQRERIEGRPRHGFARYEDRTDTDREQPKEQIEQ